MKKLPGDPAEKFKPSVFSAFGFLGRDSSAVADIIAEDSAMLEKLGVTREEITASLEAIYQKCAQAMGDPVTFAGGITGELADSRGKLPCPFGKCGYFSKGQVTLTGGTLPSPIVISLLSIHLIKMHGFFQGIGSPFRIDLKVMVEHLMSRGT